MGSRWPWGQQAESPGEMKGRDRGPAARQCREQRLTPSPCQTPDVRAKGEQGPGHLHSAQQGLREGKMSPEEQGGCRSRFKEALSLQDDAETLQRNFVFRGKEK